HLGATANFYTRDGQFTVDQEGFLVNLEGLRVQGFPADAAGVVQGVPGDLLVGTASASPRASTTLTVKANLAADAAIPATPWDPANPSATSNHATTVTVYDSLGTAHQAQLFFRRTGDGQWEWHALTDGGGLEGGTAGTLTEIASGALDFDAEGRLEAVTQSSTFSPAGAAPQVLAFDFGDALGAGGTGLAGVTQFASPSATTFIGQDGYGSGQLASVRIDAQGGINGIFTNGQSRVLGQVAVADFPAADQLERTGGNLYQQTVASGQPVLGLAGTGGRASIVSGSLEGSNVDIAEQFVRMIAAQRSFQANSKTITTADQLLGELIALKR
ncbi:MAG TPA: flagellar hook protein FlgE, partial [Anaeromyxobacteraceae bacterium]|nr:flagellar hook protein FlgE [Anaeromyxobacteraceae bacterium]